MEGFDTMTMSYLGAPNGSVPDGLSMPGMLPLDNLDHHSNFDADTFAGSDDGTFAHSLPPHIPGLKRFPTAYDDPYSDALSAYEQPVQHDHHSLDTPSIERDNKLLSFTPPVYNFALLDYAFRRLSISLSAQLHGMFFLAESPWAASGDNASPPTELTCYRRNLFQITGAITMPRGLRNILTEQGEQIPIIGQELTISATESVEGNAVKIISVPWKTPATSAPVVEEKTEKEPPAIPLDMINGQEMDSEYINFPIAWKRLQFRIATANNGRRKELQQHFIVRIKLMATLATGAKTSLCEVQSGAIIVRGRSPRNFQSRKDFPLSAGGNGARKGASHLPPQPSRSTTGDTNTPMKQERPTSNPNPLEIPPMPFQYDPSDLQVSPDFFEWKIPGGQGAMTALPPDHHSPFHAQTPNAYAQSSPDLTRYPSNQRNNLPAPINLSLTDDEPKKSISPVHNPKKAPRLSGVPPRPPSFSLGLISSPETESADLLYEYFPLGLDDWMPPVDAVYRPHVVHHTNMPQDPKSIAVKNRSKRYFAEGSPD
ncbi:p53-like transcription factor [Aulographum hederae CBS 113979]|uniref:p53-like transcription factor n=1 Tax=Aulographum hederae CBS 113979 TaxID=1176131 RepID=A0A6G1H2C7_9PEZI|nr:p53-like transcription factor [Aulographum hederae CBS 113979]